MNDLFKKLKQKAKTLKLNTSQANIKNIFDKIEKIEEKKYITQNYLMIFIHLVSTENKNKNS
ncbi:hypothetical protein [Borrelia parkeri]|uniref:hypothetical protein n=1 Tax=Borrelia parkeri TaxID=141 RepID=UPI001FF336A5|nr:hypothetical protein [Borrelia parkeri]